MLSIFLLRNVQNPERLKAVQVDDADGEKRCINWGRMALGESGSEIEIRSNAEHRAQKTLCWAFPSALLENFATQIGRAEIDPTRASQANLAGTAKIVGKNCRETEQRC